MSLLWACAIPTLAAQSFAPTPPRFELVETLQQPVVGASAGKAFGIGHGFEGGLFFRTPDGKYNMFPSECIGDVPGWDIHMQSHHWTSPNGFSNWTRGALVYNSSGKTDGSDRRASIWAPMPIFEDLSNKWLLFYVGYTCDPGQIDGAIYMLESAVPGVAGVSGPYVNATMILNTEGLGGPPMSWEGIRPDGQGTDSFFPWQLDNGTWMGFYGSHKHSEEVWSVGVVAADRLAGPWRRVESLSPADYIETPERIENPIVTRSANGKRFVAVYDALHRGESAGFVASDDGVHWSAAQYVPLNASSSGCAGVRTPMGLVPEPKRCQGCYSMLYTGNQDGYENICWALLRNLDEVERQ